jgi:type II secretory pathway pseudopilin PulG
MKLKHCTKSFTLVEMLVGIAVFSLLVLLLFSIMNNATGLWRQQSSKEEDFREARSVLRFLSKEAYAAPITTNANWFSYSTTNLAFITALPDTAQSTNYNNGDLCAVGYSWEWGANDASGVQTNMSLYRYVSFSGSTYTNVILNGGAVGNIFNNPDGNNTVRELVARNVSQFTVTCYTNDVNGTPWVCPSPVGMPNMLNVTVSTLNDRAATVLTTQAQWANTNTAFIQQNQETFTLRVRPQGP